MNLDRPAAPPPNEGPSAHARWGLFVLTLLSALSFMDRQIIAVMIEPIRREFGLSDLQVGLVSGLGFAVSFGLLGIPLGRLADRGRRRDLVALCRGLGGTITLLGAGSIGFLTLMFSRVGTAVNEAGGAPGSMSMIADLYPAHQRSRAMSLYAAGASFGSLTAFVVGAWIAQHYGWRAALAVIGAASVIGAVVLRLTMREPVASRASVAPVALSTGPGTGAVREIWREPVARWLIVAAGFVMLAGYAFGTWNFTFLVRSHGMSLEGAGWVSAGAGLCSMIGGLVAGALADRLVRRDARWQMGVPMLGLGIALPVGLLYLMLPAGQVVLAALLVWVFGFFIIWWAAPTYAAVSFVIPAERRATANSMLLLAGSVFGSGLGPVVIGLLSELLTPAFGANALRYALAAVVAMIALGLLAFAAALRSYPRGGFAIPRVQPEEEAAASVVAEPSVAAGPAR